jgi:hypothetical protein
MRAVNCRWMLTFAPVLALALLCAYPASAQEARVFANCATPVTEAPPQADGGEARPQGNDPHYATTCDVRVTDAVTVQSVTAMARGQPTPLETTFTAFDAKRQVVSTMFLIQVVDPQRLRMAQWMAEAVTKIAEARDGKERYAAYSIANDLTLLAGFDASKADFEKAVRGLKPQTLPTQLYQTALEAIAALAKEPGERKSIIIVGDGNTDDTGYTHEQVVAAARAAGIVIHALGFIEQATELPRFQILRRLAEDTGGFRREVRIARDQPRFTISSRFSAEVLENGGTLKVNFKDLKGPVVVAIDANLAGNKRESVEKSFDIPLPAQPPKPPIDTKPEPPGPTTNVDRLSAWVKDNPLISYAIGLGFGLAALGFLLFAFGRRPQTLPPITSVSKVETPEAAGTVYGWLEMLDGDASRHPLKTTNVRIGRHRDNDVCLQNDTISRRHAILHYNPDTKRFVITDLGGDNGVVVNKVRQKSHELNDGDLIELGEVRLRFRPNLEFLG